MTPRSLSTSSSDLRGPQSSRIGCRQRGAALQTRNGFEKSHDLIGAEHNRQLARLPRVRDALGDGWLAERDAVEETQGSDDLVQQNARRYEMDLEGVDVVQHQFVRRAAKIPAELRNRADVGSLCRRRHVPDRHVLDHAAAKRAQLGHRWLLSEGWASTSTSSQAGTAQQISPVTPR